MLPGASAVASVAGLRYSVVAGKRAVAGLAASGLKPLPAVLRLALSGPQSATGCGISAWNPSGNLRSGLTATTECSTGCPSDLRLPFTIDLPTQSDFYDDPSLDDDAVRQAPDELVRPEAVMPSASRFDELLNEIVTPSGGGSSPLSAPTSDAPGAEAPCSAPSAGHDTGVPTPAPLECFRMRHRRAKAQGLQERWWLEYDPPKANYISGAGRGAAGGNSINKADWPRQMIPVGYKKKNETREKMRYAFRKSGYELDIPRWGG